MDVNNKIMTIHNSRELYIHTWIVNFRNCIRDTHNWFMDIHNYTQLEILMAIHN